MPDSEGNTKPDEDEDPRPETSLHAYKEGREEDVKGDPVVQRGNEDDEETSSAHEKH